MKFSFWSPKLSLTGVKAVTHKLETYIQRLNEVTREHDYASDESSINCPFDRELYDACQAVSRSLEPSKLKYIFVIGIGGSNLGARAVYDAIYGHYDVITPNRFPKMVWLDTVDGAFAANLKELFKTNILSKDELAIIVISKSGTTAETIANADALLSQILKNRGAINDRIIAITDRDSALWNFAREKEIHVLPVPAKVGGRYSVFSAVGLLPLMLANIDTAKLIAGAQRMRNQCLVTDPNKNPALASASVMYAHYKKGFTIHDSFIFYPAMESTGKWYRQLAGESLGKKGLGITPTVSVGSVDLHSVGQLYLDGPRDKITTFISAAPVSDEEELSGVIPLVPEIRRSTLGSIMDAIVDGVVRAYKLQKIPHMHIRFDSIDEHALGEFLQCKMMEMMLLAKLMRVNAFDQPAVELYKKETRRILLSQRRP